MGGASVDLAVLSLFPKMLWRPQHTSVRRACAHGPNTGKQAYGVCEEAPDVWTPESALWQFIIEMILMRVMMMNVKQIEEGRRPLRRSVSSSQEPTYLVRGLSEGACCPLEALMFCVLRAGLRGLGIGWAGVQESTWEGV